VTEICARYYDGRSSLARDVAVTLEDDARLVIRGEGVHRELALREVRISPRLGNSPRYLYLADGARCETRENDAVDALLTSGGGLVHFLEHHWLTVAAAVLFSVLFLWAGFEHGLPAMARSVAQAVPPEMEARMGQQSLDALDRHLLDDSRLTEVDRERVRSAFLRLTADLKLAGRVRLELRRADKLGANALALPSGIVVVTDEMVELAASDEELMSVIVHELGHVHHRHILRSILQNSVTALLLAALLGDVTSVTGLAASIPTFLVEQRYSRDFEYEADAYALEWMRAQGIDTRAFAAILQRLADAHGANMEGPARYLSTHPSMAERIEAIAR
jgi:Zn-dependent protease with chaperone function